MNMTKLAIKTGLLSLALIASTTVLAGWDTEVCEDQHRSCQANCQEGSFEYGNCMANCQASVQTCYDGLARD